ncbi:MULTISPECIES: phospho-N-acetylmuramoyl-pentapeptide-transferase [unclassified Schaalia]|uniref:phospho-N-acetylmuramoyl-pentapeptide- transferase n=1 Tax=unclassified Schaalia TaxID=2691889 RepID=UPI001E3CF7FB|nr:MULTISPECIES: phospho-N-acetylmuramoyl-pentapeptide-transferase [unclassified Schaalia]MCD4549240.1 phospho-N-acetylmuramoyl-pentapeptide-transferase [Schaalia sp. lx-260]MCD4557049.1 phospho-N-acetylmuramoyl-pentapeptide-transferase [Schaalia sp. lx-100]
MIGLILAFVLALVLSLGLTPLFIRYLVAHQYGQFIRQDGPTQHLTKRGTPTMGGVVFIFATVIGWLVGSLLNGGPTWSGILLIFLLVGLGVIGLLDDSIKIMRQRSLGLHAGAKIIGQLAVASLFAVGALILPDERGYTPGALQITFTHTLTVSLVFGGIILGVILFILWANFLVTAWSNAVNLTDGLDGLAAGASIFVFGAYTFMSYFSTMQVCGGRTLNVHACYALRDPLDIAIICAALVGALAGFLWWNCSPAQIFMGDTGSLALGGVLAGVSLLTHTEFFAVIAGGLFLATTISVVIQVAFFKATGRRVFLMAPLHHHFEQKGWKEITIVIRFWLVAALLAMIGAALFYAEWVSRL